MNSLRALLVLLLSAAAARADVARFPLWNPYGPAAKVSRDGYHHVKLDQEKRRVLLDGKEVYRTTTPTHDGFQPMIALSDDGSSWALMRAEADEEGRRRGLVLTINGREIRRPHKSAWELKFSPKGGNLAYIAQSDDGKYSVVSAEGAGPSFDTMPWIIAVGERGVLYNVDWQGRRWLYRDHNPGKGPDYHLLASTPDLSRVLATYKLGAEFGASLDGTEIGRWPEIADPLISSTGKVAFFFSTIPRAGGFDRLYIDGKTSTIPRARPSDVVFNSAGVFWHVAQDVYHGAEKIGSWPVYGYEWAAASPSGRRWAFLTGGREGAALIVDGIELESGLPPPPVRHRTGVRRREGAALPGRRLPEHGGAGMRDLGRGPGRARRVRAKGRRAQTLRRRRGVIQRARRRRNKASGPVFGEKSRNRGSGLFCHSSRGAGTGTGS